MRSADRRWREDGVHCSNGFCLNLVCSDVSKCIGKKHWESLCALTDGVQRRRLPSTRQQQHQQQQHLSPLIRWWSRLRHQRESLFMPALCSRTCVCLPAFSLCHSSLRHFECRGDMWQCRVESSAAVCLPLPSLSVVQSWSSEATARKAQLSAWPPQSSAVFATLRDCRLLLYEFKENLVIWRRADGPLPLTVACLKGREEKWKKKGKSTCERKHVWGKCLVSNIGCKQLASLEVSLGYGWTVAEAAATASV